jgi:protein-arginine kinase activator protein McsA
MDPRLKCDKCDREATVHDISVRHGVRVEKHLCEECAKEVGLAPPGGTPLSHMSPHGGAGDPESGLGLPGPGASGFIGPHGPFTAKGATGSGGEKAAGGKAGGAKTGSTKAGGAAPVPNVPETPLAAQGPSSVPLGGVAGAGSARPVSGPGDGGDAAGGEHAAAGGPQSEGGKGVGGGSPGPVVTGPGIPAGGVGSIEVGTSGSGVVKAAKIECSACGMPYSEFKQHGLVGCARCYVSFESLLIPLIERAHEGHGQHVGKVPSRGLSKGAAGEGEASRLERERRLGLVRTLTRELQEAIAEERYELAAKLRDALRRAQGEV